MAGEKQTRIIIPNGTPWELTVEGRTAHTYMVRQIVDNQFTFLFGGKQVCFLAIVHYTDEEPAGPGEGVENVQSGKEPCTKVIENGQIVILKNGVRYNILGSQL